jgi:hypothetical protein
MGDTDLAGHVLEGERIIWSGAPAGGLLLTSRDWFMVPFSLFWGGIVMFAAMSALMQPNTPAFTIVWLLPFGLVGIYVIAGRFLLDAWVRAATSYAVTNKRILIVRDRDRSASSPP